MRKSLALDAGLAAAALLGIGILAWHAHWSHPALLGQLPPPACDGMCDPLQDCMSCPTDCPANTCNSPMGGGGGGSQSGPCIGHDTTCDNTSLCCDSPTYTCTAVGSAHCCKTAGTTGSCVVTTDCCTGQSCVG